MQPEIRRRSRWVIRAMEWDDDRARYPNLWHEGMPAHLLGFERVASRLRLGDLIAIYYPTSQKHPERAEKFLGLSRVVGLRRANEEGFFWIDVETAHRFEPPLALEAQPRRVFLCCDPGWPDPEVDLFRNVFDAAIAAGWKPHDEEIEAAPAATEAAPAEKVEESAPSSSPEVQVQAPPEPVSVPEAPLDDGPVRMFAGVAYGGDMRDPRNGTWLATLRLTGDQMSAVRLEPTGRSGLQAYLRDPDRALMHVEAIGMDFPFGLPLGFAEKLLGGSFPKEGWWGLVRRLEHLSMPDFLVAIQEFRDAEGETKRLTDEKAAFHSPLHRVDPDLGSTTYHGIRMIGEDRSRYAVRPFESAQGKLLLEVCPAAAAKRLLADTPSFDRAEGRESAARKLSELSKLPIRLDPSYCRSVRSNRAALEALIAARCAAVAVLEEETERTPDELHPGDGERLRREGWIYGLETG